jgi:hypothetical protein
MTNGMGYPAAVPSALNINGHGAHQQDTRAAEDLRVSLLRDCDYEEIY